MRARWRSFANRFMTTFFLVRHAAVDAIGQFLAGRMEGIHLNDDGRQQVDRLKRDLAGRRFDAVYSSPMERARETAAAFDHCAPAIEIAPEIQEIDFGEWTGKSFAELDADERWRCFNTERAATRIPGGELMSEVQERVAGFLEKRAADHPHGRIVVVSHGDVLRAGLIHYLGMSLDHMLRIEIAPASVSVLEIHPWGPRVLCMNG